MAARNPWHADIVAQIDRLCRNRTDDDGTFDLMAVTNDLAAWLVGHPDVFSDQATRIARGLVKSYDDRRRPRVGAMQPGLFQPESLIPVGRNVRVWMERATRVHVSHWQSILAQEQAASVAAYARATEYFATRFEVWKPEYETLGDLERAEFGWTDEQYRDLTDADDDD